MFARHRVIVASKTSKFKDTRSTAGIDHRQAARSLPVRSPREAAPWVNAFAARWLHPPPPRAATAPAGAGFLIFGRRLFDFRFGLFVCLGLVCLGVGFGV